MRENHCLIDKTLTGIQIAADKMALRFQTTDGDVVAQCDADCCSHTWVESVELPALGFPALVQSVENLNMPDLGDMEGCDVVAYYGCKIVTDRGEIIIDYRNDSNGYYGGWLNWPNGQHYGGVYGQNNSEQDWRALAALSPAGEQDGGE